MKKLTAIVVLIIMSLAISPGYADTESFQKFMEAVEQQRNESGRPEAVVESGSIIFFMFGLDKAMKQFKYDKVKDTYEVKEIKKFDPPSTFHKEPLERLKEAIEMYGIKTA